MTVGNFNTVLGSQFLDDLDGDNLDIVYGLLGDDELFLEENLTSEEGAFLLGGQGDDSYSVGSDSSAVILETGDSDGDTLFASNFDLAGDSDFAIIEDRHLIVGDFDSDTYILILDWESNLIDRFVLENGQFLSFQDVQAVIANLITPERNVTWEELENQNILDLSLVGLSPETIDAAIEEVKATEANFQETIAVVESGTDNRWRFN